MGQASTETIEPETKKEPLTQNQRELLLEFAAFNYSEGDEEAEIIVAEFEAKR